jgi:hypothetical protein
MSTVPSAQPNAMKNPHTNQTSNALAEIAGTMENPPFASPSGLVVNARFSNGARVSIGSIIQQRRSTSA